MSALPGGTVTFLFTDIEGSTRLLSTLGGERYHDLLAQHQQILRNAVHDAGGREIDTQGDSFFFAFGRATHAALAAVAAQRALAAATWPDSSAPRVRMGLDTGEPTVGTDRYVGIGVHRTARIMAAGHGGQILLSDTTRSLIEDELPPDVRLRDLGSRRLKDLARPVHLFQLVAAGLQSDFPPLRTLDARHRRVPLLVGAAFVVVGVAAAIVALTRGGSGSPKVTPNSVAAIDTGAMLVADTAVGDTPTDIAVGTSAVWVLNSNEQTISSIDPATRKTQAKIPAAEAPTALVLADDALWVASLRHTLTKIDPGSGSVLRTIRLPASPNPLANVTESWVAAEGRQVWATGAGSAERVSPTPLRAHIGDFSCCTGIAIGGGSVWLAGGRSIVQLDASTGARQGSVTLPFTPGSVAFGAGALWIVDPTGNKVWEVDTRTDQLAGSVSVGDQPQDVAVGTGGVWVASADGSVTNVDAQTLRIRHELVVPGSPSAIAVGDGIVWVSVD